MGIVFIQKQWITNVMADDVWQLIDHLQLDKVILIGHSMGGKTAMKMTALQPQRVEKLIVIDIAPVANSSAGHDDVFRGLFAVKKRSHKLVNKLSLF